MTKTKWIYGFVILLSFTLFMGQQSNVIASYLTFEIPGKDPTMTSAGQYFAIATAKEIQVWDIKNKKMVTQVTPKQFAANAPGLYRATKYMLESTGFPRNTSLLLAKDGKSVIISLGGGMRAYLLNIPTNKYKLITKKKVSVISPRGKYYATMGNEKSFTVVNLQSGEEVVSMPRDTGYTRAIAFTDDEKSVFVGISKFVLGFDLSNGKRTHKIKFSNAIGLSVLSAISADKKYFVAGNERFVDLQNGIGKGKPAMDSSWTELSKMIFIGDSLIISGIISGRTKLCIINMKDVDFNSPEETIASKDIKFVKQIKLSGIDTTPIVFDRKILLANHEEELGNTIVDIKDENKLQEERLKRRKETEKQKEEGVKKFKALLAGYKNSTETNGSAVPLTNLTKIKVAMNNIGSKMMKIGPKYEASYGYGCTQKNPRLTKLFLMESLNLAGFSYSKTLHALAEHYDPSATGQRDLVVMFAVGLNDIAKRAGVPLDEICSKQEVKDINKLVASFR